MAGLSWIWFIMPILYIKTKNMKHKNTEVEIRAEVHIKNLDSLKNNFDNIGKVLSHTKRLSVMYFGEINNQKTDIRVRITNGACEVAAKFGSFGASDRVEICQPINKDQFLGMVKIFSQFKFKAEVGERETINYDLNDGIVASLVVAGNLSYVELEKMSSSEEVAGSRDLLCILANKLNLKILNEDSFNDLCDRLSGSVDWPFLGSEDDNLKLNNLLDTYFGDK